MNERINTLLIEAKEARANLIHGIITYHQAKLIVESFVDAYNEKSKEVAKKYNLKPKLINSSSFLR